MTAKVPPKSAKPGKDVIYVDVDDEITGIIDKLENADQKVVALVLPKRAASLQSIVNMKLLARSAKSAGKNAVLITSETALLPLAGAAGLHVAKNLQSKPEVPDAPTGHAPHVVKPVDEEELSDDEPEDGADEDAPDKIDYEKPIGALAAAHEVDNEESIDLDDEDAGDEQEKPKAKAAKTPKDKKLKVPNFDRFRMLLGLGVVGLILLVAFLIFAFTALPKAKITIQTVSEPVSSNFSLTASSDTTAVDATKNVIPAKLETKDQTATQQVTATGSQNNGQKASGSVKFSNCTSNPVTIPAGSGVSSGGVNFITQSSLVLDSGNFTPPPASSCKSSGTHVGTVDVVAQAAGSKYNVNAGSFTSSSGVTGTGTTAGGTDNVVTILSQADVDGASSKLTTGTSGSDFTKAFETALSSTGEYVLTNTLKAGDPSIVATPAVGQPASTATVTIKITYTVLTLKKTDLSTVIEDKLGSQIDKSKQKLTGNYLNDTDIAVQNQAAPNSAQLSFSVDTTAVPIIDVNAVKAQAKNKKSGDIQTAIGNWPGVKSVDVSLSPFWVSKVPNKPAKITVVLQEVKGSSSASGSTNQ